MKYNFKLFAICLIFFIRCNNQNSDWDTFTNELGSTKIKALNALIDSYDQFLFLNYPEEPTPEQRAKVFLKSILLQNENWSFDKSNVETVLTEMEQSGLRIDMYIYESELASYSKEYDIKQFLTKKEPHGSSELDEIDENFEDILDTVELTEEQEIANEQRRGKFEDKIRNSPYFNVNGLFLYSLAKSKQEDSTLMEYVEVKLLVRDISPSLIADGFLNNLSTEQLETWYNKLIIITEIYYPILLFKFKQDGNGSS